jgi:hypothetical protein
MKAPMKGICLVACLLSSSPVALALDCRIAWDPNEAAAKVLALPDAKVTQADRWTIVAQKTGTLWAATKPSHAAHPAVVKRCVSSASGTRETSTALRSRRSSTCWSRRCWASERRASERVSLVSTEILFVVEEAAEGGLVARAVGAAIFTEADSIAELHAQVRDSVSCHFEEAERPRLIRLHFVRDEVIAA